MGSDLGKFYDYLSGTSIRLAHQFRVTLEPEGDGVDSLAAQGPFHFFARGAQLPEMVLNNAELQYQGIAFRVPTSMTYGAGTINITVLCDSGMDLHTSFINWKNVYADNSKGGGGFKGIPATTCRLDLLGQELDADVEPSASYILKGVFPSNVGGFEMTQDAGGPVTFPVTLAYQYWYLDKNDDPITNPASAGGINKVINIAQKIAGIFKR